MIEETVIFDQAVSTYKNPYMAVEPVFYCTSCFKVACVVHKGESLCGACYRSVRKDGRKSPKCGSP